VRKAGAVVAAPAAVVWIARNACVAAEQIRRRGTDVEGHGVPRGRDVGVGPRRIAGPNIRLRRLGRPLRCAVDGTLIGAGSGVRGRFVAILNEPAAGPAGRAQSRADDRDAARQGAHRHTSFVGRADGHH
jgi:hypothetical protein